MKYEINDTFTIRKDLKVNEWYGNVCTDQSMLEYRGKSGQILAKHTSGGFYTNVSKDHVFSSEMFEPLKEVELECDVIVRVKLKVPLTEIEENFIGAKYIEPKISPELFQKLEKSYEMARKEVIFFDRITWNDR